MAKPTWGTLPVRRPFSPCGVEAVALLAVASPRLLAGSWPGGQPPTAPGAENPNHSSLPSSSATRALRCLATAAAAGLASAWAA